MNPCTQASLLRRFALPTAAPIMALACVLAACGDAGPDEGDFDEDAAALREGELSLWGDGARPAIASVDDAAAVELGVRVRVDTAGYVHGVRFYKGAGNTGRHTAHLWTTSGTLLRSATFRSETATGWQTVRFDAPVRVTAGQTFIASYHTDVGRYAANNDYFAGRSVDNGPLHALASRSSAGNGVYRYGPVGFPTNTFKASNYWVDVVYAPDGSGGGGAPTLDAGTPPPPQPPPPSSGGRCPAYPAFPDASCTGPLSGTTFTSCSLNITQANATYDNCIFNGDIQIAPTAKNVKINNSVIRGIIAPLTGNSVPSDINLTLTDVEADGGRSLRGFLPSGATCIRCNIHHYAQGIYGGNLTVIDSYVHDLYGERDCNKYPGDCISHNEAVMARSGVTIRHTNLDSVFSANSTGGGMSAAIAMYTHGSFWGPVNNVTIDQSRINAPGAVYCVYAGNSSDSDGDPSNIKISNSVFVSCANRTGSNGNAVVGWLRGNGNVWDNNRWTSASGTAIPEPASSNYN